MHKNDRFTLLLQGNTLASAPNKIGDIEWCITTIAKRENCDWMLEIGRAGIALPRLISVLK
jgi:hypothetical protein